jgi:hypothetical protein
MLRGIWGNQGREKEANGGVGGEDINVPEASVGKNWDGECFGSAYV